MTDNSVNEPSDTPIHDAVANGDLPEKVSWASTVQKAFASAVIGAATAVTGTLPTQLADGVFTLNELAFTVTVTLGAAVVGFAAVWRVPNKG